MIRLENRLEQLKILTEIKEAEFKRLAEDADAEIASLSDNLRDSPESFVSTKSHQTPRS